MKRVENSLLIIRQHEMHKERYKYNPETMKTRTGGKGEDIAGRRATRVADSTPKLRVNDERSALLRPDRPHADSASAFSISAAIDSGLVVGA